MPVEDSTFTPLTGAIGRPLTWRRTGLRRYQLADDEDRRYGTLELGGFVWVRGELSTAHGRWRIVTRGWFRPTTEAYAPSGDAPAAVMRVGWLLRGTLALASGARYRFLPGFASDSLGLAHAFVTDEDEPVARFAHRLWFRDRFVLERDTGPEEASLLAGLGEFTVLVMRHRSR
jgi:hypothetical protein